MSSNTRMQLHTYTCCVATSPSATHQAGAHMREVLRAHRERAVDGDFILQVPPFRLGGVQVLLWGDLDREDVAR